MAKPGLGIATGDGLQAIGDGRLQRWAGAGVGLTQAGLELAEGVLDGGEVRRVWRQEADLAACRFNELPNPQMLVHAEVVTEHDLSGMQGGEQDLTHEQVPDLAIGRPAHRHRRGDAGGAHRRDEGDIGAVVARNAAHHPLSAGSTAVAGRQTQISSTLIDKDQSARIKLGRLGPPRRTLRLIPLARAQDFF